MKDKLERFMYGRYGLDLLGRVTLTMALICVVLNLFFPKLPFYGLAVILLILSYGRMLSRNISKRYGENQWFLKHFGSIGLWFNKQKNYKALRKDYRIFSCPSCKQKVKIPKGKGKISIHCPKCGTDFIRKS